MDHSSSSQVAASDLFSAMETTGIPAPLKFVLSHLKTIVSQQLSTENYTIWRSQVLKLLQANGFATFLDPSQEPPSKVNPQQDGSSLANPAFLQWQLIEQNLSAALCSTISPSVLLHILHLESTSEIRVTLQTRFQSTNRSKVIQLKNELHNISMKSMTMNQYLTTIKNLVDQISAAGSTIDTEDMVMYILNGLPVQYQSFKTAIRTMLHPISLDSLYALLASEEINIATDSSKTQNSNDSTMALVSSRGRPYKQRGRYQNRTQGSSRTSSGPPTICQICLKRGHTANTCWHHLNMQYVPSQQANQALIANAAPQPSEWFLDSGASSHMTHNAANLSHQTAYAGTDDVSIGDGSSLSIASSGSGLLPTPSRYSDPGNSASGTM